MVIKDIVFGIFIGGVVSLILGCVVNEVGIKLDVFKKCVGEVCVW